MITATVRAVPKGRLPPVSPRAPITLTAAAVRQLRQLQQRQRAQENSTGPSSSSSTASSTAASGGDKNFVQAAMANNKNTNGNNMMFLRVGMRSKGCSGNAYSLEWTRAREKLDESVPVSEELTLLISSKALLTILGSQMDYQQHPNRLQSGFVFENPNVKETCGCGMSFTV